MAWQDRINPTIKMISPNNQTFEAKWAGSNRQVSKKIGQFNYPKFKGTIVQDLDVVSTLYPMTIYFDGRDHDKDANSFLDAFKENGQWEVIHPLKAIGQLALQPISIEIVDDPINSANVTAIKLEWIEPANIDITLTADFLSTSILDDALEAVEAASDSFAEIRQTAFAPIQAVRNIIDKTVSIVNTATGTLSSTVAEINSEVNQITRSINSLLDATILEPAEIANSIYQLTNLPSTVSNSFQARIDFYEEAVDDLLDLSITENQIDESGYNTVKSQEMSLSMQAITVATISATSEFKTRAETIDAIEKVTAAMNDIIENLDTQQEYFENNDIDEQYFTLSASYNDLMLITSKALKLLTITTFDLQTEKRFTLEKDRSPIEITVTEYGTLGPNDENLKLFIDSNKLHGNEIMLIPAKTEVVVYVGS
jgi:prophage DNA circulation protein